MDAASNIQRADSSEAYEFLEAKGLKRKNAMYLEVFNIFYKIIIINFFNLKVERFTSKGKQVSLFILALLEAVNK